jgi:hypothetical protein
MVYVYATYESLRKILFSNDPDSGMPRTAKCHRTARTSNETNLLLQVTIAGATTEQSVTRAFHTELWDDCGSRLDRQ